MSEQTRAELQARADSTFWWHSIDLGRGVITRGTKGQGRELLLGELRSLQLPDLRGKTVLDVGAWDGFYSFEAERRGAARVVALDHYVWSFDTPQAHRYSHECKQNGVVPLPHPQVPGLWRPDTLPGKRGFDVAHEALRSNVEVVVDDFMEMGLARLGTFDVVLFLGVLYHVRHPLLALERLASVTEELAVIETHACVYPGQGDRALCEFFETNELNDDVTNWWVPNEKALVGTCRAAGFRRVEVVVPAPKPRWFRRGRGLSYRAVVHAWK